MAEVITTVLRKALAGDVKSIAITTVAAGSVGALYVCVCCRVFPVRLPVFPSKNEHELG